MSPAEHLDNHGEENRPESMNDDPVLAECLVAEAERVLGPLDGSVGAVSFQYLLPISGIDELLALFREAPSGLGVAGFERLLQARFGSVSALKRAALDLGGGDV